MSAQARVSIGALGALVVALAVAFGVVVAMDDDDMMADRGHMNTDDCYAGMMQSMGEMNSGSDADWLWARRAISGWWTT